MSDFLSALVDRALERAPVLQRRRPSWFEPPNGADGQPSIGAKQPAEDQAADVVETFEVQDAPAPARSPAAVPPRPATRPEPRELPGEIPSSLSPDRNLDAAALEQRRILKTAPVEPPPPRIVDTIVEKAVERPRSRIRPAREISRGGDAAVADRAAPAARIPPSVASTDHDGERKIQPGRSRSSRAEPAPARPAKPAVAPRQESVLRAAAAATRPPQVLFTRRTPSEPTIQVTIGRIEVRAVPAPSTTPARAGRPAAPKLNLEDYLKSRGGGSK